MVKHTREDISVRLNESTILIAGGTSGIGLQFARELQNAGNTVIVAGRRQDKLDAIASACGIEGVPLDITDPGSVQRLTEHVTATHPELDTVVLMAGVMEAEDLRSPAAIAVAERTVATNLLGPIRLIHALLPFLSQRPAATILTVTSGLAYVPLASTPTYSATKAAMHSFTESLREQLRDTTVQVIEIVPPLTRTALMPGGTDVERAMPVDEFVDEALTALRDRPEAEQVIVDRVRRQRFAERDGRYAEVFAMQVGRGAPPN
jgi:uncharacterized oxidoreductase